MHYPVQRAHFKIKLFSNESEYDSYNEYSPQQSTGNKILKMKRLLSQLIATLLMLSGCSSHPSYTSLNRVDNARNIANKAQLSTHTISTKTFSFRTFSRLSGNTNTIRLYIEGDGLAWRNKHTPSSDPTPINPLALKLAAIDPFANIIYLARPCQYTHKTNSPDIKCETKYWTSHRYSEEIIISMNEALNHIKNKYNVKKFELIGFSGGGAIAPLLAHKRNDIDNIRTIAGNLDHETLNNIHHVDQMPLSLNPVNIAETIADIPQIHFIGGKDNVVPEKIVKSYFIHSGSEKCVKIYTQQNAAHHEGWLESWGELLKIKMPCK